MTSRRERPTARFIEGPGRAGVPGAMRLRMITPAPWRPPTDVRQAPDALIVVIELAALDEAHTDVGLYDDVLVVEGVRRLSPESAQAEARPASIARTHDGVLAAAPPEPVGEIRQGPFRVEVPLPFPIDGSRVDAAYVDGLLRIVLPRRPLDDVGLAGPFEGSGRVA